MQKTMKYVFDYEILVKMSVGMNQLNIYEYVPGCSKGT